MSDLPPVPAGTITFLFTDIEGSTALWQKYPSEMGAAVARHDALLRQTVADHGGYLFKTTGDGIAAAFASASQALAAAVAAQQTLVSEPWPNSAVIRARMGVHTGEAELRGGDYFGAALGRCARLMSAGHGGQVLVSDTTRVLSQDILPREISLLYLGEYWLKDLIQPETIYQLLYPGVADAFPPLQTLDNPDFPNNLPQQLTSFVGRDTVISAVRALLGKTRLLTLTGAGGSGKTRLSLHVAADILGAYPDGVWLVEVAALSDPALVPQTFASALGIREQAGQAMPQTIVDALKSKRLMLVLDNAEHLLSACGSLVTAILRSCPQIQVIATSREPLGVAGELTYRVPSLSQPTAREATAATAETIRQYESVRLFIERAELVKPEFAVTNANASAIAQICYRLDGIPLAIELAAARVRLLTVEQINHRLDDRFRLLTGGNRAALPRQQTLRALVDWSYDLLSEQEKLLLARVAVFAGGWTLEAATAVCGFDPIEDWQLLDLLASLVDKSLVLAEDAASDTRYRMLETLRQYAAETQESRAESMQTSARHRDFFVAFAEEAESHLTGKSQSAWCDRLEWEHDNLRVALDRCAKPDGPVSLPGLRLAGALWQFWYVRGYITEGRRQFAKVLADWREAGADEGALTNADKMAVARAAGAAGALASSQGDYAAARALLEESQARYTALGDTRGIANTLNKRGIVAYSQSDYASSRTLYQESLCLYRELGDIKGSSGALNNLGLIAYRQAEYGTARSLYQESLNLYRQLGDNNGIASSLGNIGLIAQCEGDAARARALLEESLALYRTIGAKLSISGTLLNLGTIACEQGDYMTAQAFYEESLGVSAEMSYENGVACAQSGLGAVAAVKGDWQTARAFHRESLSFFGKMGDKLAIAGGLEAMAAVRIGEGDTHRAMVLWSAAREIRQLIGAPSRSADQAGRDKDIEQARAALGEREFGAAWDEGRALNTEQAVAFANAET